MQLYIYSQCLRDKLHTPLEIISHDVSLRTEHLVKHSFAWHVNYRASSSNTAAKYVSKYVCGVLPFHGSFQVQGFSYSYLFKNHYNKSIL